MILVIFPPDFLKDVLVYCQEKIDAGQSYG